MSLDPRLRTALHREAEGVEPNVEHHLARVLQRSRGQPSGLATLAVVAATVIAVVLFLRFQLEQQPGTGVQPSDPHPSPIAGQIPTGSWTVTLSDEPGVEEYGLGGTWQMRLEPDGSLELVAPPTFDPPSGALSPGSVYVIRDGSFVTNALARDFSTACAGSGTYDWSLANGELSFAMEQDNCEARRVLFSSRPWSDDGPG
jgi:hypothetical protein